ncbi:radical SAM/SPASM domain-containing protein [Chitinophaga sp. 22321]|uniref:4Fe-4S cluster-binding domain-containing protein n=1 Tax=Chitinophaga hostae TaxID=2831022 RepID=A0ABS5JA70_9BACT|nr:radical SAM protein [Chitinophaga hostae]MBS0032096.1 4Fe-4S cluster-binding domain-containing protein [Chitinophaga hostae]
MQHVTASMPSQLKISFYTVLIPIKEEEEYLIYNTLNGGLMVIPTAAGDLLQLSQNAGTPVDVTDPGISVMVPDLYEKGFLIDDSIQEREELHRKYKEQRASMKTAKEAAIRLTIGTTMVCNMGCPYCFEFVKPNKSLKNENHIQSIISYLEDMIQQSQVDKWKGLHITWYGGEPLINREAIIKLTPRLKELCAANNMPYGANIITNGIYLTKENWFLLKEHDVNSVQVTIDGAQEVHDSYRPLKGKEGKKNYVQILENLSMMPAGMQANIRINLDKKVAASVPRLFADLEKYGIWPQRYKQVSVEVAWLRTYEEAGEDDTSSRLDAHEYFDALLEFRKLQLSIFNTWAAGNNIKSGRLKWLLPELQEECGTWVSPYGIVLDPEGYIHKCWETIHDEKRSINHISEGYKLPDFTDYLNYDRFEVHESCYNCQYLPVCDQLSCSVQAINKKPPCTHWKTQTIPALKSQYLLMKENPEMIALPFHQEKENTGHSNK